MINANLIIGILFFVLGLIIHTGKANFLIAGFGSMSEEERANWNVKAVGRFMGWILIASSVVLLTGYVLIIMGIFPTAVMVTSAAISVVAIVLGGVCINLSPRFKKGR